MNKAFYVAPAVDIVEVKIESGLLTGTTNQTMDYQSYSMDEN